MSETVKISVRNLVEFILREGDIDQRRTAGADKEQMQLGARIHRKIQRQMGSDYHAEVPLKMEVLCEGFTLCLEAVSYTHLDVYKRQSMNHCFSGYTA